MEIIVDGRKSAVKKASTVGELIAQLGASSEEVLVKVNGKLAPNGAKISSKDEVKVMKVIFGG